MEPKDIVYAISILFAFLLGAWNLVQNYKQTRRASFINTVTNQRVKWIEQLRQDISTLSGLIYTWSASNMDGKPHEYELVREVDRLRHVIRLRLNPEGEHDKKIELLISNALKLTDPSLNEKLTAVLTELTEATQLLLKEEWEKVKKEAESGRLSGDPWLGTRREGKR